MTEAVALALVAIAWVVMFIVFAVARAMLPRALHYGESEQSISPPEESLQEVDRPEAGRGAV
ncbi:hypothetical protein ACFQPA_11180 [Halomarina halobia]|uniref:Uncharacterized protein n=1 Tax=Halomarina halobia TaxID=3033386 RepID=A0ABD6A9U9_9EURY|nr:hypothetical protein [Halomarina sp. PSR21]